MGGKQSCATFFPGGKGNGAGNGLAPREALPDHACVVLWNIYPRNNVTREQRGGGKAVSSAQLAGAGTRTQKIGRKPAKKEKRRSVHV